MGSIGKVIEDILLFVDCGIEGELKGQIIYSFLATLIRYEKTSLHILDRILSQGYFILKRNKICLSPNCDFLFA